MVIYLLLFNLVSLLILFNNYCVSYCCLLLQCLYILYIYINRLRLPNILNEWRGMSSLNWSANMIMPVRVLLVTSTNYSMRRLKLMLKSSLLIKYWMQNCFLRKTIDIIRGFRKCLSCPDCPMMISSTSSSSVRERTFIHLLEQILLLLRHLRILIFFLLFYLWS